MANTLEFDPLVAFAEWYISKASPVPVPPLKGVHHAGGVTGVTLYQNGRYQVQLWIGQPNYVSPVHRHLDHDNILLALTGISKFVVGENATVHDTEIPGSMGRWPDHGATAIVPRYTEHEVSFGPYGGAFMSFQYWPDAPIKSAHLDWDGPSMSNEHAIELYGSALPGLFNPATPNQ